MLGNPGDVWKLAMDLLPYDLTTSIWQRIANLNERYDALISADKAADAAECWVKDGLVTAMNRFNGSAVEDPR